MHRILMRNKTWIRSKIWRFVPVMVWLYILCIALKKKRTMGSRRRKKLDGIWSVIEDMFGCRHHSFADRRAKKEKSHISRAVYYLGVLLLQKLKKYNLKEISTWDTSNSNKRSGSLFFRMKDQMYILIRTSIGLNWKCAKRIPKSSWRGKNWKKQRGRIHRSLDGINGWKVSSTGYFYLYFPFSF